VFGDEFEKPDLLLERQVDALARRSADDVTGESGTVPLADVVLDLGFVDLAVVVERRGDGENSRGVSWGLLKGSEFGARFG